MKKKLYIVGVDGSEWSDRAVMRAVDIAKDTGAEVRLITVIPWSGIQPMTLDEIAQRPIEKHAEEETAQKEILAPLVEKYKDHGAEISTEYFWGHPVDILHERCKKEHANMLFMGRRGRSRVADLILGSVANSIAHKCGIPCVLVP